MVKVNTKGWDGTDAENYVTSFSSRGNFWNLVISPPLDGVGRRLSLSNRRMKGDITVI